ncbi:Protein of unknown function DUF4035 [uncultured Caudovirales phage]|uniref:Minor tail T domain-containing protein n=1 Tax=uncultured Caudovirales phage TaxID=2100421 RepID=A0A6J5RDN9_9CAUD|nr:Protein of unknown function DUF4035 [uncultured Caudovirales phage]
MKAVPFGEERADYRTASIVQALWNIAMSYAGKKGSVNLEECLLKFGDSIEAPTKNQTEEEKAEILRVLFAETAMINKGK